MSQTGNQEESGFMSRFGEEIKKAATGMAQLYAEIKDYQSVADHRIVEIGKPFRFAEKVDIKDRAYKFLATRMNIVDLYPVR